MADPRLVAEGVEKREQLMAFIEAYMDEHKFSPTQVEMAKALGISRRAVYKHLQKLKEDKRITLPSPTARTQIGLIR